MKELIFTKPSQFGEIKIVLRVLGRQLFFKFNQSKESDSAITFWRNKGVYIEKGLKGQWILVDLFRNIKSNLFKLGSSEINLEEDNDDKIEGKLTEFFTVQYIKNGFKLSPA